MSKTYKSLSQKFTVEDDHSLINFVKSKKMIYDFTHVEFKDLAKKARLWKQAGVKLNKQASECKKRWRHIKDYYRRERKRDLEDGFRKRRPLYWKKLTFLDDVENKKSNPPDFFYASDNEEVEKKEVPVELSSTEPRIGVVVNRTVNILDRTQSTQTTILTTGSEVRRKGTKKEEDIIEYFGPQSQANETDLFFQTMAATVNKFSPSLATKTKARVFKIVTNMELINQKWLLSPSTEVQLYSPSSMTTDASNTRDSYTSCEIVPDFIETIVDET